MKNWVWIGAGMVALVAGCSAGTDTAQTGSLSSAETAASSSSGSATDANGADGGRPHRAPPPEAFAACDGKAAGDSCTVTTPDDQTIDGTCANPPPDAPDTRLACRPNNPPPGGGGDGRGGPPDGNGSGDCDGKGPPPAGSGAPGAPAPSSSAPVN